MRAALAKLVAAALQTAIVASALGASRPAGAQALEPPAGCLGNYGNTACAALIYSQMVCDPSREGLPAALLDQQLAGAFQAAGLTTAELQVDAVVNMALNRFIPSLCPQQLSRLQRLRR